MKQITDDRFLSKRLVIPSDTSLKMIKINEENHWWSFSIKTAGDTKWYLFENDQN